MLPLQRRDAPTLALLWFAFMRCQKPVCQGACLLLLIFVAKSAEGNKNTPSLSLPKK
jgi:hypothetical protein